MAPSEVKANQKSEMGKSQTVTREVRKRASGRGRPPRFAASERSQRESSWGEIGEMEMGE